MPNKKGRPRTFNRLKGERDNTPKGAMRESSLRLLYEGGSPIKTPQTRDEWYDFTLKYFPIPIPKDKVCKDHDTPLDFFIQYVTGTLKHYINVIQCSREGFKTYTLAMGMVTKCIMIPGWEVMHLGAIQEQAQAAYNYARTFWNYFPYTNKFLDPDADIQEEITRLYNGSTYYIGALTEAFANSKRAGDTNVDEVDSVRDTLRHLLTEDLLNVPSAKFGYQPSLNMASSVRRSSGTMTYLLEDPNCIPKWVDSGICKLWNWCFKEVTERCENYEFDCEVYLEKTTRLKILEIRKESRTDEEDREYDKLMRWRVKAKNHCSLMQLCWGDLHRAPKPVKPGALTQLEGKGGRKDKARALTDRALKAQLGNIIPTVEDSLYDPEEVQTAGIEGLEFDPSDKYENHLLIDWGDGRDPTVCHVIQKDLEVNFDQVVYTKRWLRRDPDMKAEEIENMFYDYNCNKIKADSENATMNRMLENRGLPIERIAFGARSHERGKSKLWYAVGIVEKRLETELLKINKSRCAKLLNTMRKVSSKGTDKDPFGLADDHDFCALLCEYTEEKDVEYIIPLHGRQSMMEKLDQPQTTGNQNTGKIDDVILISRGEEYKID